MVIFVAGCVFIIANVCFIFFRKSVFPKRKTILEPLQSSTRQIVLGLGSNRIDSGEFAKISIEVPFNIQITRLVVATQAADKRTNFKILNIAVTGRKNPWSYGTLPKPTITPQTRQFSLLANVSQGEWLQVHVVNQGSHSENFQGAFIGTTEE